MKRILNIIDNESHLNTLERMFDDDNSYELFRSNSHDAFENILGINPHLIILDIDLDATDGIELCRRIKSKKEFKDKLVCFFTNKTEDFIQIICYENGADAFITVPINKRVLISKINALFKNLSVESDNVIIASKNLIISRDEFIAKLHGEKIKLKNKEFELLSLMAAKPDRVFSRHEIMQTLWKNKVVSDNSLDVIIFSLRKNIGNDVIENIRGVGYKFNSK